MNNDDPGWSEKTVNCILFILLIVGMFAVGSFYGVHSACNVHTTNDGSLEVCFNNTIYLILSGEDYGPLRVPIPTSS